MWNNWTQNLKKRICKYLIQRYLGQYLQEKLTLDQLTVDLYNGTGTIKNISLDCRVSVFSFFVCEANPNPENPEYSLDHERILPHKDAKSCGNLT